MTHGPRPLRIRVAPASPRPQTAPGLVTSKCDLFAFLLRIPVSARPRVQHRRRRSALSQTSARSDAPTARHRLPASVAHDDALQTPCASPPPTCYVHRFYTRSALRTSILSLLSRIPVSGRPRVQHRRHRSALSARSARSDAPTVRHRLPLPSPATTHSTSTPTPLPTCYVYRLFKHGLCARRCVQGIREHPIDRVLAAAFTSPDTPVDLAFAIETRRVVASLG
ncbi:hypothetical protein HYPSUDRAFT_205070 [Hypholoma sublateritium FD-334 SS-4]|uniref:Uncharacterized protein n=1 Tax=Hypholoma sublateritium (strain FD-334 SS-4) TaxID=945553 RepID=A0A0D2KVZ9_HYPSF|nr:hypothetical protein HYPSUDRAFT_205070 [Hypholoma sublateritium FD-334 SS-4]